MKIYLAFYKDGEIPSMVIEEASDALTSRFLELPEDNEELAPFPSGLKAEIVSEPLENGKGYYMYLQTSHDLDPMQSARLAFTCGIGIGALSATIELQE